MALRYDEEEKHIQLYIFDGAPLNSNHSHHNFYRKKPSSDPNWRRLRLPHVDNGNLIYKFNLNGCYSK